MRSYSIVFGILVGIIIGIVMSAIFVGQVLNLPLISSVADWVVSLKNDQISALANIALALIAIVTLPITAYQVRQTRRQNKASIIMALDAQWEGDLLKEPRKAIWTLVTETDDQAKKEKVGQSSEAILRHSEELYCKKMSEMVESNLDQFRKIVRVLSFVETTGYIARRGYLGKMDIIDLLGGALLTLRRVFYGYIKAQQELPGTTGQVYRNSEWIFDETKKYRDKLVRKSASR